MERVRTRSFGIVTGTATSNLGVTTNTSGPHRVETCVDWRQSGDSHPLTVTKKDLHGSYIFKDGSVWGGTTFGWRSTDNFPVNFLSGSLTHLSVVGRPSNGGLAAELLAKTNPSRPVVDLPVIFGEIRELPRLIQFAGSNLLKRISGENLKYQFAIRPLISDLMKLLAFTDYVDKRFRELQALQRKGLRRRRELWDTALSSETSSVTTNSSPNWMTSVHHRRKATTVKVWGFVEWRPLGTFPTTARDQLRLARRAVLGLYLNGASLWELIPWSWLFDWFSSVGDYLNSRRNLVPCTHSTPLIMETKVTEDLFTLRSSDWPIGPSYKRVLETKTRVKASASPLSAHLPVLSLRKMSVLASLFVLRNGRY